VIKIGLTGGIASGKSAIGRMLAERGAYVVDADNVAHDTYKPGGEAYRSIVDAFGRDVHGVNDVIDRAKLGAIVFGDAAKLKMLTDIVWPATRSLVEAIAAQQAAAGTRVFVVEAPLLLEAGWRDAVDEVWLVRSNIDAVRSRLGTRGMKPDDIEARMAARKLPDAAAADVVIGNDGGLESLERCVEQEWQALLKRAG
jgi:dephospho-CoA kinase